MLNNATIIGHVVQDARAENKSGFDVLAFSVGVKKSWKDGNDWKNYTSFIDCKVFGVAAKKCEQHITKGNKVLVSGELKQERWETDGKKYSRIVLNASEVQTLARVQTQANADTAGASSAFDDFPEDFPI